MLCFGGIVAGSFKRRSGGYTVLLSRTAGLSTGTVSVGSVGLLLSTAGVAFSGATGLLSIPVVGGRGSGLVSAPTICGFWLCCWLRKISSVPSDPISPDKIAVSPSAVAIWLRDSV